MFCKYCGKEIADDSVFCSKCGRSLEGNQSGNSKAPVMNTNADAGKNDKPATMADIFSRPTTYVLIVLALVCMVPLYFAEYRRLVEGVALDGMYWLMASPVLLSVFFLFLIIGPSVIKEAKAEEQREFEELGYKSNKVFEAVCNALYPVVFVIAILCFLISGLVTLIG